MHSIMISGDTLRTLRLIKGIKQETVAVKLGISQPAYCKLEHASHINRDRLDKIIFVLGYTEEEFEKLIKLLPAQH